MKHLCAVLFAVLFVACGGSAKGPENPDQPVASPNGGVECAKEIALVCAAGTADGCLDGRTLFHACVADGETGGPECAKEIAKVCPDGQVDGCLSTPQLAANHICVVAPAAEAAP